MNIGQFLPKWLTEVPAIADLATALDGVWKPEVSEPAALLLDVRNLGPDSERELLRRSAFMLGYTGRHQLFDNPRLHRLITHMPKFRSQNATELYKSFLAFLLNHPLEVDNCWTDDYVGFFSVPFGPELVDALGNRRPDNEGWYPTTHVIVRCRPKSIFPDSLDPYNDMLELFYKIAPAYVVVEHLGAVADMLSGRLQLNIGVIEGYSERVVFQDIEIPSNIGDWQPLRPLPYRVQGHSAQTVGGKTLITGGYTGQYRNENTCFSIEMSGIKWQEIDAGARTGSDITCHSYSGSEVVLGTTSGELLVSSDGINWTKAWTPLVDKAEPVIAILHNHQNNSWMLCGSFGTTIISTDPKVWGDSCIATTALKSAAVGAGIYLLVPSVGGTILYSLDGINWSGTKIADTFLIGAAYHTELDQWIVVGQCSTAWVSQNLIDWTPINAGIGDFEVKYISYCSDNRAIIIFGNNAVFGYSYDMLQWFTPDTLFRTQDILAATYIQWTDEFFIFSQNTFVRGKDSTWNRYKWPLIGNRKETIRTINKRMVQPPKADLSNVTDENTIFQILFNEGYVRADGTGYLGSDVRALIRQALATRVDVRTLLKPVIDQNWTVEESTTVTYADIVPYPLGIVSLPLLKKIVVYGKKGFLNTATVEAKIIKKASMGTRRAYHSSFVYSNIVYAIGGYANGASIAACESYNYGTNSWTSIANLPTALHDTGTAVVSLSNDNWAIRYTGFGENSINSCVYDVSGRWLIGGQNGFLAESDFAIHWNQLESPFPSKTVTGFTANSSTNVYHLYGYQTKTGESSILVSYDTGRSWTAQDTSWITGPINTAKYFEKEALQLLIGGIHAPTEDGVPNVPTVIGATGLVWTVDDVTSTMRLGSKSVYGGTYSETYNKYIMCVDGGVMLSLDKKSWTYSSFLDSRNEVEARIPCLAATDLLGTIIALSADGNTYFSTDAGQTWGRYYTGTVNAAGLSSEMEWDQTAWIESEYYFPRYASMVSTPWNSRVWASVPSGLVFYSQDRGYSWITGGAAGTGDTPFARKLAISTELELIGRTMGIQVGFSNGNGVPSWTFLTVTDGIVSETKATAICYIGNQRWLVGGEKLWLVSNPTGIAGPVETSIEEIPVRFTRGPNLTYTYVSGVLEQQVAQYQITCIDEQGETRPSDICVAVIPASTEGVGVSLSWTRISGARGYRLYGRKQGAMYLLAELSGDATNFIDDGTTALRLAQQLPISDTSGFMGLETKTIVDIVWSARTGVIHAVTDQGYIARSTDARNWYGVLNPAVLASSTRTALLQQGSTITTQSQEIAGKLPSSGSSDLVLPTAGNTTLPAFISAAEYVYPGGLANVWQIIIAEPQALYVVGGSSGQIGTSTDGENYSLTVQGSGSYVCSAFDKSRNIVALGATSGQVAYTQGKVAAVTPQISNVVVTAGGSSTTRTLGYYQYMIAAYRDTQDGTLSIASGPVEVTSTTQMTVLTMPVDNVEGYKVYRLYSTNADMSGLIGPDLLGILLANAGQKTLTFEDHGSSTTHSPQFFGTGLNDISWTLTPADTRLIQKIEVVISSVGTPDKVRWRVNGGAWSAEYEIAAIATTNNISFNFGATTGHTLRDRWSITVRPAPIPLATAPFGNETGTYLAEDWLMADSGKPLLDIAVYTSDKPFFVGVGANGVTHCHELDTWEPIQSNLSNLFSVTSGTVGTSNVLVFGGTSEVFSTSSILTTALRTEVPLQGPVNSLAFDPKNKQFVGVSVDSQIITSANATNWVRRNVATPKGDLEFVETGLGNQALVTGGTIGTVFSSFDCRAWATVDADTTNGTINCIIADDQNTGTILLAGDGGTLMRSTDNGTNWTQVIPSYSTDDQDTFGGAQTGDTTIVLYGYSLTVSNDMGATFATPLELPELVGTPVVGIAVNRVTGTTMIVTTGSRTYLSYDSGQDWSPTSSFPDLVQASSIAYGNNTWFVAGYDGRVAYSLDDGSSWVSFDIAGTPYLERLYVSGSRQRIDFVGCCYEDNAFIVIGTQGDCFRIDVSTWTPVPMNTRLYGNAATGVYCSNNTLVCYGNRGVLSTRFFGFEDTCMVVGGLNNNLPVSTTYRYNVGTNSWSTLEPLPSARYGASAVATRDSSVLVIGGCDSNGVPLNSVVRYLPHLDTWTSGPAIPYHKGWTSAHKVENCRIVVNSGGIEPKHRSIVLSELEAPISKKWLTVGLGELVAGTYGYRVSAVVGGTETLPTSVQTITVANGTGVLVDWQPVPGATEYRVYGRDTNGSQVLATVYPPTSQYLDTGASINLLGQSKTIVGAPIWQDLREQLPLPREYFASSFTPYGLLVCGGGTDDRCWVLNFNERSIVRSAWDVRQDLIYVEDDYVESGYVE